jgi:cobalamin 5'-phosphate synthase/cobalamin synthase
VREALALLTPFGGARPLTPRAVPWFPWVGLVVGAIVGGTWWVAGELWPPAVAAAVVVVVDLAVTGLLHLDGLVDSADGLLPHLDRDRRLEVMAEPGVGAFGVAVAGGVLLLRWAALSSADPRPFTVMALWTLSRLIVTVAVVVVPPARPGGMGDLVAGITRDRISWTTALAIAMVGGLLAGAAGSVVPALGAAAGVGVVLLGRRRLGGYTGDVLGAAVLATETVGLLLTAAKW